jgi:SMODS and SLOG-associating 2TM effector domain 1
MTADRSSAEDGRHGTDSTPRNCAAALQPIVRFGVTGHRNPADPDTASQLVIAALSHVLATMEAARRHGRLPHLTAPSATELGFQIVSPLAEGADRIVAAMVLSTDARLCTRPRELTVPLPFPLDYYRGTDDHPGSDCQDVQSQAEFDHLYAAACQTRLLHAYAPSDSKLRTSGYNDAGKFVVGHSDLLIALWDGQDNGLDAGTAAIVRLALRRGIPVIWVPVRRRDEPSQSGPDPRPEGLRLLLASADRGDELENAVKSPLDLGSPAATAVLTGHRRAQQPLQELLIERLARLDELLRFEAENDQARQDIADQISRAEQAVTPVSEALVRTSQWMDPPFVLADDLARRYQTRLRILTIGVYAAAATAIAFGAFAAIIFPYGGGWRLLVVFEAIVLVALLTVQWLDFRKICRDRWVAFRAMSEYLRIGRYLALVTPKTTSGLDFNRVVRLNSWSSEPSLTPWFAPVLERLWDRRPDTRLSNDDATWLRDYIITGWVGGQIEYHEGRRDAHERWDRNFKWAIRVTLFATVLAVALHALRDYFPTFLSAERGRDLISATLAFVVIVLTGVAAAFNGYAGQQRHNYHHARFRRMARELDTVQTQLDGATSLEDLRQNIAEVRRVTLGEATDWFEDMRDQPIDSPT